MKAAVLALLLAAATAQAAPVISVAARGGNVKSEEEDTSRRVPAGACFWSVPGVLQLVNLHALQSASVSVDEAFGSGRKTYVTTLTFGRYQTIRVEVPRDVDTRIHLLAIEARMKECAR